MSWDPTEKARIMLTFDPEGLTGAQRDGDACVVCHKKWPRPRIRVGTLPNRARVFACPDCAEALCPSPPEEVLTAHVRTSAAFP
ncbi:hypothetical protein Misp01_35360 [Microtetraspora sp. NBRC 13810]|uniref:hypothetical protein n=1 Tax=Microtetraspora sp. NBRC 13810 TaxID=3030990 RepID=UPI0024A3BC91|nr:hypothetical protein [Microtetraspora sp. NBRC 13810]GLW08406.1 hypothetical protein Misp01_35360 [Microtetraspora sp. NBRC 13810]